MYLVDKETYPDDGDDMDRMDWDSADEMGDVESEELRPEEAYN